MLHDRGWVMIQIEKLCNITLVANGKLMGAPRKGGGKQEEREWEGEVLQPLPAPPASPPA